MTPQIALTYICDFCGSSVLEDGVFLCATPWQRLKQVAKAHICLDCARVAVEALEEAKAKAESAKVRP